MRFDCNMSMMALAVLLQSTVVNAETVEENRCERFGITRTVELQADNESGVPCRVLYHKPMEDQSITNLWNARNDAQFCSTRYDEFIIKLETRLNWSCEQINGADPSLLEDEVFSRPGTVMPGASGGNEATVDNIAIAIDKIARSVVQTNEPSESSHINESPRGRDDASNEKLTAVNSDNIAESEATTASNDSTVRSQRLKLARALPEGTSTQYTDSTLTMKQIELYIPSGNYVSYKVNLHSDNSPLCPADGFFYWSMKSPGAPVFEMGADLEFQFDLTPVTELPVASASRSSEIQPCEPKISAGFCSNERYTGNSPLHPVLSSYFECDRESASSHSLRPLVLVRTLISSESSASECSISENYQHLALAPSLPSSGSMETAEKHDIELVILPRRTNANSMNLIKGYVCRYVRGS